MKEASVGPDDDTGTQDDQVVVQHHGDEAGHSDKENVLEHEEDNNAAQQGDYIVFNYSFKHNDPSIDLSL